MPALISPSQSDSERPILFNPRGRPECGDLQVINMFQSSCAQIRQRSLCSGLLCSTFSLSILLCSGGSESIKPARLIKIQPAIILLRLNQPPRIQTLYLCAHVAPAQNTPSLHRAPNHTIIYNQIQQIKQLVPS